MSLFRKWNEISLIIRILGGLIVGVILGLLVPHGHQIRQILLSLKGV